MRAVVESVERRAAGSQLVSDLTIGGTLVAVDSAREFEASGQVLIAGSTLDYDRILWADEPGDGVTHDTLVLHAVSPVSGTARVTAAEVPGSVEFVAQVRPRGSGETVSAVIDHPLIDDDQLQPGTPTEVLQVRCEWRGSGSSRRLWLAQIIGRAPKRRGEFLVPGTANSNVVNTADTGWAPLITTLLGGSFAGFVLSGTVAPGPSDGNDGDWWINTATRLLYGPKTSGAWPGTPIDLNPTSGGGTGGVDIDCGNASATGVEIDCGAA